jgi:hypothetical protein
VASPLAFTLGSAGVGGAVSASVIAATAVAALAVPLWPSGTDGTQPEGETSGGAAARDTGRARADGGGEANSGVRLRGSTRGPLRAEHTGPAIADGPGSRANSGVEETDGR